MKALDLVPSWVWAAAVAGLVLLVGVQEIRVAGLESDVATLRGEVAAKEQARTELARRHDNQIAQIRAEHAIDTMTKEQEWNDEKSRLEERRRADAVVVRGLRDKITSITARDRGTPALDPIACERAADRLEALGDLLAEGVELVVEGRGILERRDAEVARLTSQIAADRKAVEAAIGWQESQAAENKDEKD